MNCVGDLPNEQAKNESTPAPSDPARTAGSLLVSSCAASRIPMHDKADQQRKYQHRAQNLDTWLPMRDVPGGAADEQEVYGVESCHALP